MSGFIFHIKSGHLQRILTADRNSSDLNLYGTGLIMPDYLQETDITHFLIVFIFIEIEDTRVHSCLQSCLFLKIVYSGHMGKRTGGLEFADGFG